MHFAQFFIIAITTTSGAATATAIIAAREFQTRKAQSQQQTRIFIPAQSQMDEDVLALAPNPELLHAIRRLG